MNKLKYNKRKFRRDLWEGSISNEHNLLLNLFFKKSLIYPKYKRVIRVFSILSFMFGMLDSDEILSRSKNIATTSTSTSLPTENNKTSSSILSDLPKSSINFSTIVINFLVGLILIISKKIEKDLMSKGNKVKE